MSSSSSVSDSVSDGGRHWRGSKIAFRMGWAGTVGVRVEGPTGQFSLDEGLTDLLDEATDSWRLI